ncbi:MAG: hypothetical protein IJD92_05005 [Bacilli bacterium]|nr:hypothetical protein [Bacilli bacterium]
MMGFRFLTDKKKWNKEAEDCINYALEEIQKEYREIKINEIVKKKILNDYFKLSDIFSINYVKGNMDSFEKAACLMTAINKNKIIFYGDNQIKDISKVIFTKKSCDELNFIPGDKLKSDLAIKAALKMCEEPIYYFGDNWNTQKPEQLEKFNFRTFAKEQSDEWKQIKEELFIASHYSYGKHNELLTKFLMLKYLYKYINSKVDVKSLENDNREEQPEEMIQKYNRIEDKAKQSEILKEIDKPKTLGKRN